MQVPILPRVAGVRQTQLMTALIGTVVSSGHWPAGFLLQARMRKMRFRRSLSIYGETPAAFAKTWVRKPRSYRLSRGDV